MSVHADAIAKQSAPLDTLINGPMKEAESGVAEWKDVEEATFIRFCQFAYTGDYKTPEHELQPEAKSEGSKSIKRKVKRWNSEYESDNTESRLQTTDISPERDQLKVLFEARRYEIREIKPLVESYTSIRPNKSVTENYTPVFLAHAQLYVLAEKYGVHDLKQLALYKLHKTLCCFKLYKARIADVVELARYSYSDENTQDRTDGEEELRSLVVHYIVSELHSFKTSVEFLELVEDGGAFSRDLLLATLKELVV